MHPISPNNQMKELNPKEPTIIQVTTERKGTPTHVGRVRPKPGHTLFKFCQGHLSHVTDGDYSEVLVMGLTSKRLNVEPQTDYFSALNLRNAVKKLNKRGFYVKKYTPC